jgi:hypothetical protein
MMNKNQKLEYLERDNAILKSGIDGYKSKIRMLEARITGYQKKLIAIQATKKQDIFSMSCKKCGRTQCVCSDIRRTRRQEAKEKKVICTRL